MAPSAVEHVDPTAQRGPFYRAWLRVSATRFAQWLSPRTLWKIDPVLMRLTRGRFGMGLLLPTVLLQTRGRRTGQARRNAVIYFNDGDRVTVVASKLGMPEHPAWFHNLTAEPDVLLNGEPYRASVVEDEAERSRLWRLADRVFPPYAQYRERAAATGRSVPIVQLVPRQG